MKLARPTFVSVAALFFALSLTAAQAGPQTDGGAPAAANPGAGDGGPAAGPAGNAPAGQPGSSAGQSGTMGGAPDGATPKGSAAGSPSATDDAGKESKGMAEDQTDTQRGAEDGKATDRKSGSAAENQPDTRDGMSEDKKSGAAAEGKGDAKAKTGKSARLESKDVSKVRSHFSQNKPRAKRIDRDDVSVSIGIALPGAIVLYDLPPDVIVVGGPCPIQYFVWDDDVVLVDSCTREVVEIIADVA